MPLAGYKCIDTTAIARAAERVTLYKIFYVIYPVGMTVFFIAPSLKLAVATYIIRILRPVVSHVLMTRMLLKPIELPLLALLTVSFTCSSFILFPDAHPGILTFSGIAILLAFFNAGIALKFLATMQTNKSRFHRM